MPFHWLGRPEVHSQNGEPTRVVSRLRHRRCGTGIWPDRDIAARRRYMTAPRPSSPDRATCSAPHTRRKSPAFRHRRGISRETPTVRWSEVDSNFRFRDALSSPTAWPWSRRLNDRLTTPICWWAGNCSADRPRGSVPKRLSRICRLSRPLEPSYEV
jgi:hypothetical protein